VLEKGTSLRGVRDGGYRVLTWKDEMITEYKNKTGIMIVRNERNVMQKPKPKQRMKQATETVYVKKQR
jgi:ribosomal protein S8